jgi:hypothetical protein
MKKIAFLFLVLDNPNFINIWNEYFKNNKEKYEIYIHPKYPEKVTWNKSCIIPNLKETSWGHITEAYIELLKEAYKDKNNYKFVTISESCIPIQTFNQFYINAINDPRSWIKKMKISKYNIEERLQKHINKSKNLIIPKIFLKNYARFCLNRIHVKLLLEKNEELSFFHSMHVGDEFFLSVLNPIKNVKNFAVVYDDWDYIHKKQIEIKNKIKSLYEIQEKNNIDMSKEINIQKKLYNNISKNPKTINNVKEDLNKIKKCNSYFYRKFSKNSNIEKYWNEIINYHLK